MLSLDFRSSESHVRYWSEKCLDFARFVDDASLAEPMAALTAALADLQHDRRMMFVGAKACGKSTLLSGVTQMPFMATHLLEEPCVRWRYSCRDGDYSHSRFIDDRDLLGLELVDTAPLENEGQVELLLPMVGRCDVLVCVLSAINAASHASMWDFIEALPADWSGHCVVAVTHTDKLAAQDSLDLKALLRERCHAFESRPVALYFVPALVGTRTMDVFASKLEETLNSLPGHRGAIRRLAKLCDLLLHDQRLVLSARESVQRNDYGFVDSIDREVDEFEQAQLQACPEAVEYYLSIVKDAMPHFLRILWRAIRPCSTPTGLIQLEFLPQSMELYFYRSCCNNLLSRQADADQQLVMTCEGHWKDVRPRMLKTLGCDIDEFNKSKLYRDLTQLRERFMKSLYEVFMQERVRQQFSSILLPKLSYLRWCFLLLCMMLVIAGILGTLEYSICAFIFLCLAGLCWLGVLFSLYRVSKQVHTSMEEVLKRFLESLRQVLTYPMQSFITQRVEAYRRMYALPRRTLAAQAETLKPMLDRHAELQRELRTLEPYL